MRVLSEKTESKSQVSSVENEKAQALAKAKERLAKNEEKLRKEENAKKPNLFKVVLAQAASEAVQLKTKEEIPPPTNVEIGQKHGKKVMGLVMFMFIVYVYFKGDGVGQEGRLERSWGTTKGGELVSFIFPIHHSLRLFFTSGPFDKSVAGKS